MKQNTEKLKRFEIEVDEIADRNECEPRNIVEFVRMTEEITEAAKRIFCDESENSYTIEMIDASAEEKPKPGEFVLLAIGQKERPSFSWGKWQIDHQQWIDQAFYIIHEVFAWARPPIVNKDSIKIE